MNPHRRSTVLRAAIALLTTAALAGGCNRYGYEGHLDALSVDGLAVRADGWIRDTRSGDRPADECFTLRWSVDGVASSPSQVCGLTGTAVARPDVESARGPGATGFRGELTAWALRRGTHEICLDVAPRDAAITPFTPLDCRSVDVPYEPFDSASLDVVDVNGATISAAGWYRHVVATLTQNMDQVAFSLDGTVLVDSGPTGPLQWVERPDAIAAAGPRAQGVTLSVSAAPGTHEVCLGVTRPEGSGFSALFGDAKVCRTVVVTA